MDSVDTRVTLDLLTRPSDSCNTEKWASMRNKDLLRRTADIVRGHKDAEEELDALRRRVRELEEQLEDCDCDEDEDEIDKLKQNNAVLENDVVKLESDVLHLESALTEASYVAKVLDMS